MPLKTNTKRTLFRTARNSTRLTFKGVNQFGGLYKFLEPVMRGEMKKELDEELIKLKSLLEERVPV